MVAKDLPTRMRLAVVALVFSIVASQSAAAQGTACSFPGHKPMLIVQLFFGQSVKDRSPVSQKEWRSFLGQTVTPRFPDGFTVYDAYGQWMNPQARSISHEKTKVIVIATEDTQAAQTRIDEVTRVYRDRFHQQSVGIVTSPGCGAF